MKKTLQLLIFTLVFSSVFGQEQKDILISKTAFGINLSPTYNLPHGSQKGDVKYGFDTYAKINLNKILYCKIGLSYDVLKSHTNLTLNYNNEQLHRETKAEYSFFSLPISLIFQCCKSKFQPYVDLGLQNSILTQNSFTSDDEIWHTKEKLFDNGSFIMLANLGLGFIYKTRSNLDLNFGFNYSHALIPLIWDNTGQSGTVYPEKVYLNYLKMNIGLLYNLH